MSQITNWTPTSPIYQQPGAAATQGTGNVGTHNGASVAQATTPTAPSTPSGIGNAIKSFFGGIKETFAELGRKITDHTTYGPLASKMFDAPVDSFSSKGMSAGQKLAGSYAFVKDAANGTNANTVDAFMRENCSGSKLTMEAGNTAETRAVTQSTLEMVGDDIIALNKNSYGLDTNGHSNPQLSRFAAVKDGTADLKQLAQDSVDRVDDVMCHIFGTPGDQSSIDAAAARYPQSLCDQLGTLFRAVDDSGAPANLKDGMKLHLARDALALRSISPSIATAPTTNPESKASFVQLSKAVQNLVNGVGMGMKDTHPDVITAGAHMKDRWEDGFGQFVDAIVARADPDAVANAVKAGNRVLDARV